MTTTSRLLILGLLAAFTTKPLPALAQAQPSASAQPAKKICDEGRQLDGQCVDAKLAVGARETAETFAQPNFSYTAPPRLPGKDFGQGPATNIRDLDAVIRNINPFNF